MIRYEVSWDGVPLHYQDIEDTREFVFDPDVGTRAQFVSLDEVHEIVQSFVDTHGLCNLTVRKVVIELPPDPKDEAIRALLRWAEQQIDRRIMGWTSNEEVAMLVKARQALRTSSSGT